MGGRGEWVQYSTTTGQLAYLSHTKLTSKLNQSWWLNEYSTRLPFWEIGESVRRGFESGPRCFKPWSSQTNDFKIDTCRFLACQSTLLG